MHYAVLRYTRSIWWIHVYRRIRKLIYIEYFTLLGQEFQMALPSSESTSTYQLRRRSYRTRVTGAHCRGRCMQDQYHDGVAPIV